MAEEKNLQQAKKVYETLCSALTDDDWHFTKDDGKFEIKCGAQGDNLPIDIMVKINTETNLVVLMSCLPFVVAEDKRVDLAAAVSIVNNKIVDGSFDFDIMSGHLFFRMTNCFIESELGKEAFIYMLYCSCQTIDEYNSKFKMLVENKMTLGQFVADN